MRHRYCIRRLLGRTNRGQRFRGWKIPSEDVAQKPQLSSGNGRYIKSIAKIGEVLLLLDCQRLLNAVGLHDVRACH